MEQHGDAATDNISIIDEAFADCIANAAGPHSIAGTRFDSLTNSDRFWEVRMHGAFLHPTKNSRPASNL